MRTTVDVGEEVLKAARERALQGGTTLSAVVEEALRSYLTKPETTETEPFELVVAGRPGGRFPAPREVARILEDEEIGKPRPAGGSRGNA